MARAFLGVGSNIWPRPNVIAAMELLSKAPGISLRGISTFYRTLALHEPMAQTIEPRPKIPDFLNGVLEADTELTPQELNALLAEVEDALGRERTEDRYASRVMDLDLLVYVAAPELENTPTHPDVFSRGFVALPLFELAPDLLLPPDDRPLAEVAALFDGPGVRAGCRNAGILGNICVHMIGIRKRCTYQGR